MSATWAIQSAIVTLLRADATLAGLSLTSGTTTVVVYNDVPEGGLYPHVLFSRASETPWHTMGGASAGIGWKNVIRAHVYSRYQGDKEALEILRRIVTVLNYQTITVAGFSTVICEYEQHRLMVEDVDKIETRHVVGEFCVYVHQ